MWALTVLTALNFFNYVDRNVLAAVLTALHRDPAFAQISDARMGLLQTAFLFVYMVASPAGGLLGARIPRRWVVAGGVAIWSAATVWSGLARSYSEMLAARSLIGFGEAGYAAVAPAIINDLFRPERRARMLAVFYTATYAGSALGFVIGGAVAQAYGWRAAFYVAGLPGFVFALLALFIYEPPRAVDFGDRKVRLLAGTRELLADRRILVNNAGQALLTFALGGLAFWAPSYFVEAHHLNIGQAGTLFGGVSVIAGLIGTVAGGIAGDAWYERDRGGYLALSGWGMLAATPLLVAGCFARSLVPSLALFFAAELLAFLNAGPLNAALLASAPPSLRELVMGVNVLFIHLFGDATSPWLLGALSDHLTAGGMTRVAARTVAMAATAIPLALGGALLVFGARWFRPPADQP